jgi:protein farnesyltransferase/geranylgeranyltransferase type-1 subunit alpha
MSDSTSDSETQSSLNYVPYVDRPEWSDIVPIRQDDGPNPVVRIAYTERFSETFDYLRACMQTNELSNRALALTTDACRLNPANYTVWCYRRQLLDYLESNLNDEIEFIGQMIDNHPKNYQVSSHVQM